MKTFLSLSFCLTRESLHNSIIRGENRFNTCTGSCGASHHRCDSPEFAVLGFCAFPSVSTFFHFDVVGIDGSAVVARDTDGGNRNCDIFDVRNFRAEGPAVAT